MKKFKLTMTIATEGVYHGCSVSITRGSDEIEQSIWSEGVMLQYLYKDLKIQLEKQVNKRDIEDTASGYKVLGFGPGDILLRTDETYCKEGDFWTSLPFDGKGFPGVGKPILSVGLYRRRIFMIDNTQVKILQAIRDLETSDHFPSALDIAGCLHKSAASIILGLHELIRHKVVSIKTNEEGVVSYGKGINWVSVRREIED